MSGVLNPRASGSSFDSLFKLIAYNDLLRVK